MKKKIFLQKKNNRSYFDNADDSYDLFISDGNNGNY